jgi:hypothetical protein
MYRWTPLFAIVGLAGLAGLAGCPDPLADCLNTATCPAPLDAGAPSCDGECVPVGAPTWGAPFLVWIGDIAIGDVPPSCPNGAPQMPNGPWHAPGPAPVCPACQCKQSTGTCTLPTTVTANAFACGDTGTNTPLDPPNMWDGSCAAPDPIQANADCNGEPCVQSVTIGPLNKSDACEPYSVTTTINPAGLTFAMSCNGTTAGQCADPGDTCVPGPPHKQGSMSSGGKWTYCLFQEGDVDPDVDACPTTYKHRYTFADDIDDTRGCTECTCGQPEGSKCTSDVGIYSDNACSASLASDTVTEQVEPPWCLPLPPGSALGSVSATTPTYTTGKCQPSGGGMTGQANLYGPVALCCLD